MYPFLFKIGPIQVASFGVMLVAGFLVSLFVLRRELARKTLDPAMADTLGVAAMFGGLAGARLYYLIETFPRVLEDPAGMIFSGAGFTFYGGLAGGALAVILVIRHKKQPMLPVIDALALVLPIGYAFGRVGCQLAGDGDYGKPTDLPWGMAYPNGVVPTHENVHPTPLYEIGQALIIFWALWKLRTRLTRPGQMFCWYLIFTGFARLTVEFVRINPPRLFGLTDAQLISIAMMLGGGVWLMVENEQMGKWANGQDFC